MAEQKLNSVHLAALSLCSAAINNGSTNISLSPQEAEDLFVLATRQNIAALCASALPDNALPLTTKLKFSASISQTSAAYNQRCAVMTQLLTLFNTHGIDTMLLKGISLSLHYPKPDLRHFGDLDFYQYGRWQEADRLVAENFGVNAGTQTHHHSKYTLHGVLIENHYDFISRYGNRGNKAFERLLKDEAAALRRPFSVGGQACFLPPPTFSALFLMRHMAAHFAADRVTLRHLVDWTLFCRKEGDNVDWPRVCNIARQYGYLTFAQAIETICQQYLGHTPHMGTTENNLSDRVIHEMLVGEFTMEEPSPSQPFKRLSFKWRRLLASRWKHAICYSAPWSIDLLYSLWAKIVKPHTILH